MAEPTSRSTRNKILLTIGAIVLFFVLAELGLHIAYRFIPTLPDPRLGFSSYKDKSWAKEIFDNEVAVGGVPLEFDRYVEWKRPEFHSTYINIDADGRRATWNPEFASGTQVRQIYTFGASTMFGAGARDDYTIPSDFSRIINGATSPDQKSRIHDPQNRDSVRYRVTNYARSAFILPQSVIYLVTLLQAGERPEYVIFYGGTTEVNGAYDSGDGAALGAEAVWRSKFNAAPFGQARVAALELIRNYCLTCRSIINVARKFDLNALRINPIVGMNYSDAQIDALAEDITQNYANALDMVDHLSRVYGFKYIAFWEPSLFGDEYVGDEEKLPEQDWRLKDPKNVRLYVKTTEVLRNRSLPHFYDLSNLLQGRSIQIFLDDGHISEEGQEMVAEKMVEIFLRDIAEK